MQGMRRELANEQLSRYISNWLHVTRMNNDSMPKIMLNYRPNGRRRLGRPLKTLDDAETGLSKPNLWRVMMTDRMGWVFGWRGYMTWRLQYVQKRVSHKLHAADYLQVS